RKGTTRSRWPAFPCAACTTICAASCATAFAWRSATKCRTRRTRTGSSIARSRASSRRGRRPTTRSPRAREATTPPPLRPPGARRPGGGTTGVAWVDLSTGAFSVEDVAAERLADVLTRIAPAEVLAPDDEHRADGALGALLRDGQDGVVTPRPDWTFDRELGV